MYNVFIPKLINDASTGVVTLRGEIARPGKYIIGRDETLHDLIDRAGGFSSVAYPLGAVFTRASLKAAQKEGNDLLARQVEEAVLKISQSEDKTGVGEQIAAVMGYAKQLRQQEVSGRLTVNVLQRNKSAPVYMQDGDVLMVPKRPGHVSIFGSVQKNTVASYAEDKRLSAYLASAGGTNRIADRRLAYIVLPNGESDSVNNDSIIPPGSVIVVPPKTDRLSALSFTEIVSRILGNIALSFLAINNAR
jgi:protein involved in polysaccharide export with SLBB domain